jgi:hypothetical protein
MPSKGSERITLRIPEPWYTRIMETIERNNLHTREEPWVMNTWIIDAIKDKLLHQERARLQKQRRRAARQGKVSRLAALRGAEEE